MLYDRCQQFKIPHRKTEKLILATSKAHKEYLAGLESKAHKIEQLKFGKVPLSWLSGEEVREVEPDVGPGVIGALVSPETGIVSSHALMENLESEIAESDTGELVYGTRVVRIDRAQAKPGAKRGDGSEDGWVVQTLTGNGMGKEGERSAVLAKVVVNAAGLK
jgi:2-hydroxyglutarate dehydrogenase